MNNNTTNNMNNKSKLDDFLTEEMESQISTSAACQIAGIAVGALGGMLAPKATPLTRVIIGLSAAAATQDIYQRSEREMTRGKTVENKNYFADAAMGAITMGLVSCLTNFVFGD